MRNFHLETHFGNIAKNMYVNECVLNQKFALMTYKFLYPEEFS